MSPRYVKDKAGNLMRLKDEYIELLTIFPDNSDTTEQFLTFLQENVDSSDRSKFRKLWGGEN
jgi:CRISPR-associated protein Cmr6